MEMTKVTSDARTGMIRVNGTDIYHEIRGQGPAILFISGATGDELWRYGTSGEGYAVTVDVAQTCLTVLARRMPNGPNSRA